MVELGSLFSGQHYKEGQEIVPVHQADAALWIDKALRATRSSEALRDYLSEGTVDPEASRKIDLSPAQRAQIIFTVEQDIGETIRIRIANNLFPIDVPRNSVTIA